MHSMCQKLKTLIYQKHKKKKKSLNTVNTVIVKKTDSIFLLKSLLINNQTTINY